MSEEQRECTPPVKHRGEHRAQRRDDWSIRGTAAVWLTGRSRVRKRAERLEMWFELHQELQIPD